jgi:hypothetical protein
MGLSVTSAPASASTGTSPLRSRRRRRRRPRGPGCSSCRSTTLAARGAAAAHRRPRTRLVRVRRAAAALARMHLASGVCASAHLLPRACVGQAPPCRARPAPRHRTTTRGNSTTRRRARACRVLSRFVRWGGRGGGDGRSLADPMRVLRRPPLTPRRPTAPSAARGARCPGLCRFVCVARDRGTP